MAQKAKGLGGSAAELKLPVNESRSIQSKNHSNQRQCDSLDQARFNNNRSPATLKVANKS